VKVVIETIGDEGEHYAIESFDQDSILDLRQSLDDPNELFLTFEIDDRTVLLNKLQIVSVTIS
jgi:hypothetical protein